MNYDYSTYKPHHYDVPKLDLNKIPLEKFKSMVLENNEPLSTERYPNYMRGSESFSGKFQAKSYQITIYGMESKNCYYDPKNSLNIPLNSRFISKLLYIGVK